MPVLSRRYRWFYLVGGLLLLLLLTRGVDHAVSASAPRPTPTCLPSGLEGSEVAPEGVADKFPDLIVESITTVPRKPLANRWALIEVRIGNQGAISVTPGNNFLVDLYVDPEAPPEEGCPSREGTPGDKWWGAQGQWMAAGASYVLTTTWLFTDTQTYHLYAQVDTGCHVVETDEYNNIEGPVEVWVRTSRCFRQESHADFQYGFSNVDISHPHGILYLSDAYSVVAPTDSIGGIPALDHRPDVMVNDITYAPAFTTTFITDTARQERPVMVSAGGDVLYMVWEDGRNGQVVPGKDIYFARSLDGGKTWSEDVRVNQDPITATAAQGSPALVFDQARSTLCAIWHDNRAGNYDIYLARSTDGGWTWEETEANPINDDLGSAGQTNPSLAIGDDGTLYAVWQDERNGNSDIYFAQSLDGGDSWRPNVLVTDEPESTEQRQTSPSLAVHGGKVYVVWEDERNSGVGDPADIYFVPGWPCNDPECDNPSFDVDRRVDNDTAGAEQRQPVLAAHDVTVQVSRTETIPDPVIPTQTIDVECYDLYEGQALHFAWQDFRAGQQDPDIYYAWTSADFEYQGTTCVHPPETIFDNPMGIDDYQIAKNEKVNDRAPCMGYCLPSDHEQPYSDYCDHPQDECWGCYEQAFWQGHPAMVAKDDGVFLAWSDGRVFDDYWNYDIWVASTYWDADVEDYVISGNVVINDNAKLYQYLNAGAYTEYGPASARQDRPTLALCDGCFLPYVAWEDNRRADPLGGCTGDYDIYFARPVTTTATGIYLSPVFAAESEKATWYMLDWWGVTPYGTNLSLQTRIGNTPWPDENWGQWTGPVAQDGGWVHDAPGQHIVDEHGNPLPQSRYIQYRVNLATCPTCTPGVSPCLSRASLYYDYELIHAMYLPLTLKSYAPGGSS